MAIGHAVRAAPAGEIHHEHSAGGESCAEAGAAIMLFIWLTPFISYNASALASWFAADDRAVAAAVAP